MNEKLQPFIDSLGIDYTAVFVPQSASRNAGQSNPTLNWRVTVKRVRPGYLPDSPIVEIISTDYMQGIGHLPEARYPKGSAYWLRSLRTEREKQAAETGKAAERYFEAMGGWTNAKSIPAPLLRDVLHSLLLDGAAADTTFHDWCSEYGYDDDSRKALSTYDACRDTGHQLQRTFTAAERATLSELFQDY